MTNEPRDRYRELPPLVDPADLVGEVPVSVDDRTTPALPPAAAPELVAATQFADGNVAPRTMRRPGKRAGAWIIAIGLGVALVPAVLVALFG